MGRAGVADPPFRRTSCLLWSILAAAFLLFSGINSYLAPFGIWQNRIFGLPV